jgi:CRP-like cAMP-binding protein
MIAVPLTPRSNRLLAKLPDEDYERLHEHLEPHSLTLGESVYKADQREDYLYFPTTAIVSLVHTTLDGATAEMGIIGNEGAVGIAMFMGGGTIPNQAIVQGTGDSFRIRNGALHAEFERSGPFQLGLLRYTQALIIQISQTAVCNRHHTLEQQLCRWLLLTHDRTRADEMTMTHEMISHMLGVRRAGITEAAKRLSDMGLIRYARGRVTFVDRQGLEAQVCECYRVVKQEYDRLLN